MIIQIFGTRKCRDTQKALRFFKERGVETQFVDLNEKKVSKGELKNIIKYIPVEELIDEDSKEFKSKNLKYMTYDSEEELLNNPLLFKTPIVRADSGAVIGYVPDQWKILL